MTPTKKKLCFLLIDGIGDRSNSIWKDQTSLQYANLPNIDALSKNGINGLMDPVEPGLACGSDTAHMSIFGYDPKEHYKGRGSFETMGAGLDMKKGDIAFKSNFAIMDSKSGIVTSRRADRNFEELGPPLCDYLTKNIVLPSFPNHKVTVKYATEHRCGVRVRGESLSGEITGTDPLRDNKKLRKCLPKSKNNPDAVMTSKLVNELSDVIRELLPKHPINAERKKKGLPCSNVILLRGCGVRLDVKSFTTTQNLKGFMIAPTAIICGLGLSIGLDTKNVPGATGDYHTNLDAKHEAFIKYIKEDQYNFGFLHVKAVDDAGHDGKFELKVKLLEKIDTMVGKIIKDLIEIEKNDPSTEHTFIVTGDHTTPCQFKDHTDEPVPFLMCKIKQLISSNEKLSSSNQPQTISNSSHQESLYVDSVEKFNEIDASYGVLGRFQGKEVFKIIKNY